MTLQSTPSSAVDSRTLPVLGSESNQVADDVGNRQINSMTITTEQKKETSGRKKSDHSKPTSRFSWTLVNFWLDAAMFFVFLGLVWVATITRFIFPAATAASGWTLWGWGLDEWLGIQFGLVALLTFGIVVHLMLHWSWVCGVFFSKLRKVKAKAMPDDGTRTIYGVGLMIVILNLMGLLIAAAALTVQAPL